jgi:hypothetical protein
VLPDDVDDVRNIFSNRGAYRRFRDLIERRNVLDRWYAFSNEAQERALRDWCEVEQIELED